MKRDYKTDEIKDYIKRLNKISRGISSIDEQHLTALIIQATPIAQLPTLHSLDVHHGLPVMIASYIENPNTDTAYMLANYIQHLYVDHFKKDIKRLVEDKYE